MTQAENLGELVWRDRISAGLKLCQLVTMLNEAEFRPIDVHTKKARVAKRIWVARLEEGLLKRELSLSIRLWLAKTLNGNINLYKTLPINKPKK